MKNDEAEKHTANYAMLLPGMALTLALFTQGAYAQPPAVAKSGADSYETLYLTNLTSHNDSDEIQTDLRNMLPQAKLFYVASQSAISIRGTAEDIALARKIISDLDRSKKVYRLTYTITDIDNGKRSNPQRYSMIVTSGSKTELKQGSKVPLVVGTYTESGSGSPNTQVQYQDVGLQIEAALNTYLDGVRLGTKIGESTVADEKSGIGMQDPVFHQTTFEGTSTLVPGKSLVLGSLDFPGGARKQEVEVVSEVVR